MRQTKLSCSDVLTLFHLKKSYPVQRNCCRVLYHRSLWIKYNFTLKQSKLVWLDLLYILCIYKNFWTLCPVVWDFYAKNWNLFWQDECLTHSPFIVFTCRSNMLTREYLLFELYVMLTKQKSRIRIPGMKYHIS